MPILLPDRNHDRRLARHSSRPIERVRLSAARTSFLLAEAILRLAFLLFRAGLLDRFGVRCLMQTSKRFRQWGWKLWRRF